MKRYKGSIALLDTDHTVKNKWRLGNCQDQSAVIVIGKDKKLKFVKKTKSKGQANSIKNTVVKIVEKAIK